MAVTLVIKTLTLEWWEFFMFRHAKLSEWMWYDENIDFLLCDCSFDFYGLVASSGEVKLFILIFGHVLGSFLEVN